MTAHRDLDRQLTDFLRDGPAELPYESFDAVRDRTEHTGQRVVIGPWRLPEMNKTLLYGLGAAAVVVIGLFLGYQLLRGPAPNIGVPSAEPTATENPSSPPSAPQLSQSFTSTQHGISLSYPEGWNAQAATEPWTASTFPLEFGQPHADWLSDPTRGSDLFLTLASQPLGDSTPEDWAAAQMAGGEGCAGTEAITVDGAAGLIGTNGCNVAVVTTTDRGYWIQLYTGGAAPDALAAYDRAWFEEVLATVQFPPSAPPMTGSFTSTLHGISVSYPEGWDVRAATEPWTESTFPLDFTMNHADWISDPVMGSSLFLALASQQIGDLRPEEWVGEMMNGDEGCGADGPLSDPVIVDGASGLIGTEPCNIAVIATAGRGYWIQLYTSEEDPGVVAAYDRAWFEEFLATVQLNPDDAVD